MWHVTSHWQRKRKHSIIEKTLILCKDRKEEYDVIIWKKQ